MKVRLLAVGSRVPDWVEEGFDAYASRLPRENALVLEAVPASKRRAAERDRAVAEEGERLLSRLKPRDLVIALDERGSPWSTVELSDRLQAWRRNGRDVALLVGGPDGLHSRCLERAEAHWSLSALTLPHGLVRVLVAEQIYRAWTLITGHPYHRE
jgi:23S rRNA (pseudouridine1915-N3)-methyltransferase